MADLGDLPDILRRLLKSSISLIMALIAGYAVSPALALLPETPLPLLGLQPGAIPLLIIGAIFLYSLLGFIKAVLRFIEPRSHAILERAYGILPENSRAAAKLSLNAVFMAAILVAYWALSPALCLMPGIGGRMAAVMGAVVASITILFFWDVGVSIYRGLDGHLSARIENRGAEGLALLRKRALKAPLYFFITIAILIAAYALFPAISDEAHVPIPSIGLSIGMAYWITALAATVPPFLSMARNLMGLFGLGPELISKAFPMASAQRISVMRRLAMNLTILMAILISFSIISPLLARIPGAGGYLSAAGQMVAGAITVLFFWDVGRSLYLEMEGALAGP
ncbi:MAG: hypothetical protein QW645_00460 [Candidatus Bathyarchaeia archaeon]